MHIVSNGIEVPAGSGELCRRARHAAIRPALCNAIFAATGKRIRELPIGEKINV